MFLSEKLYEDEEVDLPIPIIYYSRWMIMVKVVMMMMILVFTMGRPELFLKTLKTRQIKAVFSQFGQIL